MMVSRITGTFGGTWTAPTQNGTGLINFNGVMFDRATPATSGGADGVYELSGGGYTVSFSGGDVSGGTGCQMSGARGFTMHAGQASGSVTVTGTGSNNGAPRTYQFMVLPAVTDRVTVTRSGCPMGAGNGTTAELNVFAPWQTTRGHQSTDGITYADSEDQTLAGSGQVINWSFTGTQ